MDVACARCVLVRAGKSVLCFTWLPVILPPRFQTSDFNFYEISFAFDCSAACAVLSDGQWAVAVTGCGVLVGSGFTRFWYPSTTGFAAVYFF